MVGEPPNEGSSGKCRSVGFGRSQQLTVMAELEYLSEAYIRLRMSEWIAKANAAGWIETHPNLLPLLDEWDHVEVRWGADSASARGVLLALAREIWASYGPVDVDPPLRGPAWLVYVKVWTGEDAEGNQITSELVGKAQNEAGALIQSLEAFPFVEYLRTNINTSSNPNRLDIDAQVRRPSFRRINQKREFSGQVAPDLDFDFAEQIFNPLWDEFLQKVNDTPS